MTTWLAVAAIALAVIAVVQIALICALLSAVARALRMVEETRELIRNVATAVSDAGHAARQVGDLAGTARTLATGLLGTIAFGRLAPKLGSFDAVRAGFQLARSVVRWVRARPQRQLGDGRQGD